MREISDVDGIFFFTETLRRWDGLFISHSYSPPRPLKEDKLIREIRHPAEPLYFASESLQIPLAYIYLWGKKKRSTGLKTRI